MVAGLPYSRQKKAAVPPKSNTAVTVRAILLCNVKKRKVRRPLRGSSFSTRRRSHHTTKPKPPRITKAEVVKFISGCKAYSARLFSERMSIPALQKAETEWNTPYQMPTAPYWGMNTVMYKSAPAPSTASVPQITFFTNRKSPERVLRLKASCKSKRSESPILRFSASIKPVITVMTPKPPTWISKRITACPNTLQVETVGTVTSPVTQVEVTAVNSAST